MNEYGGKVPEDFDELLKLPGVGRKSANLIVGDVFGKPAIVTDTHCIRLANRIGLVDGLKDPKKVEFALREIIPPEEGNALTRSATDWCCTGAKYAVPGLSLSAENAVWRTSVSAQALSEKCGCQARGMVIAAYSPRGRAAAFCTEA